MKPILTETEYDIALSLAQELEHRSKRTPEEDLFLELLVTLIEKFEDEHYPIPTTSPNKILRHILEASRTQVADLIGVLGPTNDIVLEILNGERPMNEAQAEILAAKFKVSPSLFI